MTEERQQAQTEIWKIPLQIIIKFFTIGSQILQKVFSLDSGVSIFVYTQNSSGHGLGQPALADPDLSRC